jgi:hypothetical protein
MKKQLSIAAAAVLALSSLSMSQITVYITNDGYLQESGCDGDEKAPNNCPSNVDAARSRISTIRKIMDGTIKADTGSIADINHNTAGDISAAIEPALGDDFWLALSAGNTGGYVAVGEGKLYVETAGSYSFRLLQYTKGHILIDGKYLGDLKNPAIWDGTGKTYLLDPSTQPYSGPTIGNIDGTKLSENMSIEVANVELTAGPHKIQFLFGYGGSGDNKFLLAWKKPGAAEFESVTASDYMDPSIISIRRANKTSISSNSMIKNGKIEWMVKGQVRSIDMRGQVH